MSASVRDSWFSSGTNSCILFSYSAEAKMAASLPQKCIHDKYRIAAPKESLLNIDPIRIIVSNIMHSLIYIVTCMHSSPQGCHMTWNSVLWTTTYQQSLGPSTASNFKCWFGETGLDRFITILSYQLTSTKSVCTCNIHNPCMLVITYYYLFAWGMDFSGSYKDAWDLYQILPYMLDHLAVHGYGWIEAPVADQWTRLWEIPANLQYLRATWT